MDDLDVLHRHAELVRDELGEGRLVALAVAVRAGQDLDVARRVELESVPTPLADTAAQLADHLRRRQPAGLDVGREADAAQLAARLGLGAAGLEALVVGDLDRLVDDRRVVARIVLQADRRLVREGRRRDEVLPAQLGRIHLQLGGRLADDASRSTIGRLGTSGAAIGVDRRGVRQRRPSRWRR